ncbi:MAG: Ppx/GppA family phosphatase [Ignavibacteria bacterium]|nr:Ppx/GppA family phosphatase [Ignavibacteria bacterium]
MNPKFASIDIGTNTVLLTIAELSPINGSLTILDDVHSIARLGQGVDTTGKIAEEAISRVENILKNYRTICDEYSEITIKAVGTSCLRDASNSREVCDRLSLAIGVSIEVLSGDEEARFCYIGTVEDDSPATIIDIGGGSTEIISGRNGTIEFGTSIDIGAVRLTERYFNELPVSDEIIEYAKGEIYRALTSLPQFEFHAITAVAGTPTTVAAMVLQLKDYNAELIHNYQLYYKDIQQVATQLSTLTKEEIIALPGVHPKRADILLAGVLLLKSIMEFSGRNVCTVSTKGLRYGVLKEMTTLL